MGRVRKLRIIGRATLLLSLCPVAGYAEQTGMPGAAFAGRHQSLVCQLPDDETRSRRRTSGKTHEPIKNNTHEPTNPLRIEFDAPLARPLCEGRIFLCKFS